MKLDILKQISKKERYFLIVLFVLSVLLRFSDLGYSSFYGDETKALYLDKTVPALQHLLNQRKGPVQFIVTWVVEVVTGGYSEGLIRLPFAVAGLLSIFVLYFLVKKAFNVRAAAIASLAFSLNGFFIAFSRTAQYQSFLILFGLLSVYFALSYRESKDVKKDRIYLVLIGVCSGLGYLTHWDAMFFDLAVSLLLIETYLYQRKSLRDLAIYLLGPFLLLIAGYFIPYFYQGYFANNFLGYFSRRVVGLGQLRNNSLRTIWAYNPSYVYLVYFFFSIFAFLNYRKGLKFEIMWVFAWLLFPFVFFQVVVLNPGTHIYNFVLPLTIMASVGFVKLYGFVGNRSKNLLLAFISFVFFVMALLSAFVYVPRLNRGYPWRDSNHGVFGLKALDKSVSQLFLYGFPYRPGWEQVAEHFERMGKPRTFYTNDNLTVAEYHLRGIHPQTLRGADFPEALIIVKDGQEDKPLEIPERYVLDTTFVNPQISIYRR